MQRHLCWRRGNGEFLAPGRPYNAVPARADGPGDSMGQGSVGGKGRRASDQAAMTPEGAIGAGWSGGLTWTEPQET